MSRDFEDFMKELHEEARREGPRAVAQLAVFDAHYRLALQVFDLRKARRMTQRQLAAKAGMQQAEIRRIEAGNSNPTLSTIAILANALGAEPSLRPRALRKAPEKRSVVTASRRPTRLAVARRVVETRRTKVGRS